mgnify:CR=1 FL=1
MFSNDDLDSKFVTRALHARMPETHLCHFVNLRTLSRGQAKTSQTQYIDMTLRLVPVCVEYMYSSCCTLGVSS